MLPNKRKPKKASVFIKVNTERNKHGAAPPDFKRNLREPYHMHSPITPSQSMLTSKTDSKTKVR